MPWDAPLKKVVRRNTDFTGNNVWLQDKQANIKIIAQRHDTHDEDLAQAITACLNLDGINAMRAALDVGTHKVVNLVAGTATTDAVNKAQMDVVAAAAAAAQASADAANSWIATSPAVTQVVNQTWDGSILFLDRSGGTDISTPISLISNLRVGAFLLHKSAPSVTGSITVSTANHRYRVANNGALAITFTVPVANDASLGADFVMEGSILFTNGATPGPISLNFSAGGVLNPNETLGIPNITTPGNGTPPLAGSKYMLSYFIHYAGGTYNRLMVWTAVP